MSALIMYFFAGPALGLDLPIRIGCGNGSEVVDGDKIWLAGDEFATTPLADWDFGSSFEFMSPDPAPAEVYQDSYHKNDWTNRSEYDEISIPIANGIYRVRLHLFDNNGDRAFDIIIEDEIVLDDYDPQAEAKSLGSSTGTNVIVIPEVIVEVSDSNGSQVGYLDVPFAELVAVYSGSQAMPLFYNNIGGVSISEGSRTFAPAQDWTRAGIKHLTLYVYGKADNVGGQFYVKIQ